jgi:hypothetical protein
MVLPAALVGESDIEDEPAEKATVLRFVSDWLFVMLMVREPVVVFGVTVKVTGVVEPLGIVTVVGLKVSAPTVLAGVTTVDAAVAPLGTSVNVDGLASVPVEGPERYMPPATGEPV